MLDFDTCFISLLQYLQKVVLFNTLKFLKNSIASSVDPFIIKFIAFSKYSALIEVAQQEKFEKRSLKSTADCFGYLVTCQISPFRFSLKQ